MKKTYMAPYAEQLDMEVEKMIATSDFDLNVDAGGETTDRFSAEMGFDEVESESDNYWEE